MTCLSGLLLLTSLLAPTDDWTRFRGPDGAGHGGAKLPAKLTLDAARWRVDLPGGGHSSPVVSGELVIVTCVDEPARKRWVIALDAAGGQERWRHGSELVAHGQHDLNSLASSTPALGDGRVHLLWTQGPRLIALTLSLKDGQQLWSRDLGEFTAQHGSGVSPVLASGVLLVPNEHEGQDSCVLGLDPASGAERWRLARQATERRGSYATPTLTRDQAGKPLAILASTTHGLVAIDPVDGTVRWQHDPGFGQRCVGSPVVCAGVVFQAAGSGGGGKEYLALGLPAEAETNPQPAWSARLRALPYVPTPVADEQYFYLVSDGGVVTCLEAATGTVRWQERLDGRVFASPILVGSNLLVLTTDGLLEVLATGPSFKRLATLNLDQPCQATPAACGGSLYVRTHAQLIAFGD